MRLNALVPRAQLDYRFTVLTLTLTILIIAHSYHNNWCILLGTFIRSVRRESLVNIYVFGYKSALDQASVRDLFRHLFNIYILQSTVDLTGLLVIRIVFPHSTRVRPLKKQILSSCTRSRELFKHSYISSGYLKRNTHSITVASNNIPANNRSKMQK